MATPLTETGVITRATRLRAQLLGARFYGILDLGYVPIHAALDVAAQMAEGGVQIIQLRAKDVPLLKLKPLALAMRWLLQEKNVLYIVNDHIALAREVEADGVHIGQEDGMVLDARRLLHRWQLIGKSTHSLAQAVQTAAEKPDYIAVGPIFATPTKPDYTPVGLELIGRVAARVTLPQFCIGGINLGNLDAVLTAGATRVVMVSAILQNRAIAGYCRLVRQRLG